MSNDHTTNTTAPFICGNCRGSSPIKGEWCVPCRRAFRAGEIITKNKPTMECDGCCGWNDTKVHYEGDLTRSVFATDRTYYPDIEIFCPDCTRKIEGFIRKEIQGHG